MPLLTNTLARATDALSPLQSYVTASQSPLPPAAAYTVLNLNENEDTFAKSIRIIINPSHDQADLTTQFNRLKNVENLHLIIQTQSLYSLSQALPVFIKAYDKPLQLKIEIEFDQHSRISFNDSSWLTHCFSRYNCVEYLEIHSRTFSESEFEKLDDAVRKNKAMRSLAENIMLSMNLLSDQPEMTLLSKLGKFYGDFWALGKNGFINQDDFYSLLNADEEQLSFFKKAENYHLFFAVSNQDFDMVREEILPLYNQEEKNALYYYHGIPETILGNVSDKDRFIELCNNHNFCPLTRPNYKNLTRSLFNSKNILCKQKFFLTTQDIQRLSDYQTIILDALAYLVSNTEISSNKEEKMFCSFFSEYHSLIDCNTPIQSGIYKHHTLMQLIIKNLNSIQQNFAFSSPSNNESKEEQESFTFYQYLAGLNDRERLAICNKQFPDHSNLAPLTTAQALIFNCHSDLLNRLTPTNSPICQSLKATTPIISDNRFADCDILDMFLLGLIAAAPAVENCESTYRWLITPPIKTLWQENGDITTRLKKLYPNFFPDLPQHTYFQVLCREYPKKLIYLLRLHQNHDILNGEVINMPFPEADHLFRDWTALQMLLYQCNRGLPPQPFEKCLHLPGVNINVIYPSHRTLKGLNLLQATIFFSQNNRLLSFASLLTDDLLNTPCKDQASDYYGMTALHLAIFLRSPCIVNLLDCEKTDYTIAHSVTKKSPLQVAIDESNTFVIGKIKEAERRFPHHLTNYQNGLNYNSEINPSFKISSEKWVVSILRKKGHDHAFLILEGLEIDQTSQRTKAFLWVAHLLYSRKSQIPKIHTIEKKQYFLHGGAIQPQLLSMLKTENSLIALRPGMIFFPETCYAQPDKCQAIWNEIKSESLTNIRAQYSRFGTHSLLNWMNCKRTSSSIPVINCVDWAASKYNSLAAPHHQLKQGWDRYIVSHARGFLNYRFNYVKYGEESELEKRLSAIEQKIDHLTSRQNHTTQNITQIVTFLACLPAMFFLYKWQPIEEFLYRHTGIAAFVVSCLLPLCVYAFRKIGHPSTVHYIEDPIENVRTFAS